MTDLYLHPGIIKLLKDLDIVFNKFGIDFYVVGAVARDIHLSADMNAEALRKTNDVDLAISINDEGEYNKVKKALIDTGKFSSISNEPIKLLYEEGIEIDLLPFGEIEGENRNVVLKEPKFVLNMPGFREIYPFLEDINIQEGLAIKVCSMEGIVLLKLISYDDRPHRNKDISDIEHVIKVYFDLYSGDIYQEYFDTMDLYDTNENEYLQLVSARVIGRKMKLLLANSEPLLQRIQNILSRRQTNLWMSMLAGTQD